MQGKPKNYPEKAKGRRRPRWGLVILIILLPFALCATCTYGFTIFITSQLQPMSDQANNFMLEWREGDTEAMYAMIADEFHDEYRRSEYLRMGYPEPEDWHFTNFQRSNDSGSVRGTLYGTEGENTKICLRMILRGEWKVSGIYTGACR